MTQEEAKQNTQEKVKTIEAICKQMKITISAEQAITNDGLIKNIVFYTDNEKYVVEDPKKNEEPTKEAADLRKKDIKDKFRIRPRAVGGSQGEKDDVDPGDIKKS